MFSHNNVPKSLIEAVKTITKLDEKQEMKTVPVAHHEKNRAKLADLHKAHLDKGYVYTGSEEKEGPMNKWMTHHNYISKDSSHHKHMSYPSNSIYDKDFEISHLTTRNNVYQHHDLSQPHNFNENVELHNHLDLSVPMLDEGIETPRNSNRRFGTPPPGTYAADKAAGKFKKLAQSVNKNKQVGTVKVPTKEDYAADGNTVESSNPFSKDYKSQAPTKPGEKAGFDSKKISTGTVYTRKPPKADKDVKEECAKNSFAAKFGKDKRAKLLQDKTQKEEVQSEERVDQVEGPDVKKKTDRTKGKLNPDRTRDTLRGKEDGGVHNAHTSFKVTMTHNKPEPKFKKEEVEPLEELSKDTLNSYADKSHKDLEDKLKKKNFGNKSLLHRAHGMQKASDRLKKEEVEPLEELSRKTLGNYVKKAHYNSIKLGNAASEAEASGKIKKSVALGTKAIKRDDGIHRAANKLSKEEVTPLSMAKSLAKNAHKKIRKEMLGVAGGGSEAPEADTRSGAAN